MYAVTRYLCHIAGPVQHRNQWPFDHVLIDVSFFANSLGYLTRDLVGHERDCETVKNVHRQLQTVILRRLQPRKSLAFLLDGSEPLWMLEHRRLFPGRRYDSRVYRSCASPMPYLLEEKLRGTAMEQRTPPSEAVISGPATPGLAEGKMSAYLLDLATRILRPPTFPPLLDATVTAKDTVCLVGGPELAWLAVGMTPFRNITSVTLQQGELKSCSLQESMVWMRLDHLLRAAPEQVLATPFADVLDAYVDMEKEQHSAAAPSPPQNVRRLRSVLFDEEPVTGTHLEQPGLRLRLVSLQQLLVRIVRALSGAHVGLPAGNRPTPHAATLLEMTLQTHGLLCGGGVPSQAWSPTPDPADGSSGGSSTAALNGTVLLDKFPRLSAEMLLQHVTYLLSRGAKQRTANSADGAGEGSDSIYLSPQRTRHFGLTGVETLLLSATRAEQVNQVLPLYVRGHTLPDEVASDITQTRNIHEAVRKTQRVLSRVLQQASQELASRSGSGTAAVDDAGHNGPHPALAHLPSHLFVRTAGARGPPPGWKYYGVHLGIKAEAMNVRYSLNASDTATLHLIDSNGSSNSGDVIAAAGGEVEKTEAAPAAGSLRILAWNTQLSFRVCCLVTLAECPAKLYNLPSGFECKDAWAVMRPNLQLPSATAEERGYTTDGTANAYAQKHTDPKLYGRPHRALLASTQLPSNDVHDGMGWDDGCMSFRYTNHLVATLKHRLFLEAAHRQLVRQTFTGVCNGIEVTCTAYGSVVGLRMLDRAVWEPHYQVAADNDIQAATWQAIQKVRAAKEEAHSRSLRRNPQLLAEARLRDWYEQDANTLHPRPFDGLKNLEATEWMQAVRFGVPQPARYRRPDAALKDAGEGGDGAHTDQKPRKTITVLRDEDCDPANIPIGSVHPLFAPGLLQLEVDPKVATNGGSRVDELFVLSEQRKEMRRDEEAFWERVELIRRSQLATIPKGAVKRGYADMADTVQDSIDEKVQLRFTQ
ncbi:hypothetical protein CGC21_30205 [Leishmania donovani]|uniref:Uncharacterized protein n=1 Tax=Leishmania donovani TaxID=5661 RepID=A0A504X9F7_LEIDO|nr:hypothetical protein CGC21_30205 [Leishmania donovani]